MLDNTGIYTYINTMPKVKETLEAVKLLRHEKPLTEEEATRLFEIIDNKSEKLATKQDVAAVEQKVEAVKQGLEQKIEAVKQGLEQKIASAVASAKYALVKYIFFVALGLFGLTWYFYDDTKQDIARLETRMDRLETKMDRLDNKMSELERKIDIIIQQNGAKLAKKSLTTK